jgi:hypothetical protein
MRSSKKFNVSWRDILHGFITAFLTASTVGILDLMSTGVVPDIEHFKKHAVIGLYGGFAYLIKKFITNSEGKILKKDPNNKIE